MGRGRDGSSSIVSLTGLSISPTQLTVFGANRVLRTPVFLRFHSHPFPPESTDGCEAQTEQSTSHRPLERRLFGLPARLHHLLLPPEDVARQCVPFL